MTATAIETKESVVLAQVLADVFRVGLPVPIAVTLYPAYFGSEATSAVSFQFDGPDETDSVAAWADWADVSVEVSPYRPDPSRHWHSVKFAYAGVLFDGYALTGTDA